MNRYVRVVPVMLVMCVVLFVVPEVFGQSNSNTGELGKFYDVTVMEAKKPWLQWLIGTFLMFGVLAVAVLNPHRSHLD